MRAVIGFVRSVNDHIFSGMNVTGIDDPTLLRSDDRDDSRASGGVRRHRRTGLESKERLSNGRRLAPFWRAFATISGCSIREGYAPDGCAGSQCSDIAGGRWSPAPIFRLNCNLGGGLLLPHPNGIVIHPDAQIGPNCLLFHQVTIGEAAGGVPTLEGHVDVGAGAKIIGQLRIGKHAKIGANAVVLTDVPAGATAVGVPARIIQR